MTSVLLNQTLKKKEEFINGEVHGSGMMKRTRRISQGLKNGLYVMNWLFLVSSAMTLIIGLYLYWKFEVIQILMDIKFNPDLYIIGLSIFLFFIGCVGYVAITHENICLFYWYLLSLVILMMLYVPIGLAALKFSADGYKKGKDAKEVWIALHNYFELPVSRKLMDEIQNALQCCGITDSGYRDWNHNFHLECNENNSRPEKCSVPSSCCKLHRGMHTDPKCGTYVLNNTIISQHQVEEMIYTRGCLGVLGGSLQRSSSILGVLSLGSACIVFLSFILTVATIMKGKPQHFRMKNYLVGMRHNRYNNYEDLYPVSHSPIIDTTSKPSAVDLNFTL